MPRTNRAGATGLAPATSGVTDLNFCLFGLATRNLGLDKELVTPAPDSFGTQGGLTVSGRFALHVIGQPGYSCCLASRLRSRSSIASLVR
jgi:hypothetical protein